MAKISNALNGPLESVIIVYDYSPPLSDDWLNNQAPRRLADCRRFVADRSVKLAEHMAGLADGDSP